MFSLKNYSRNKARAEGSIAEGYNVEGCLTLFSLVGRCRKARRPSWNQDVCIVGTINHSTDGRSWYRAQLLDKAHRWILFNFELVKSYIE